MTIGHYGLLPTTPDPKDYRFHAPKPYAGGFVDLSDGFRGVPYDQLNLGSCVSNGTAAAADYARVKGGLDSIQPSRLFIYWNGRKRAGYPINQDTGLQIRDGLMSVSKDGAPPETDWTYDVARFAEKPPAKAYSDGTHDLALKFGQVDDIDAAIASGVPVVQGFEVFSSFESDEVARTGIVPMPGGTDSDLGGHCTVIVSTPKDGREIGGIPGVAYRKHLNSWGGWALQGYYWAPVAYTAKYAADFWVITAMGDPNGPQPPQPPADPDHAFAQVLHPWVATRHTSIAGNAKVAAAAKDWLQVKAL